ncbi:MAG: hypothetical protein K0U98_19560 [Deltaproteobacteria bacterium]|nr:hypothetical protein [Deltaproteobacteria bacterium]
MAKSAADLGFVDYLKAAFFRRWQVPLLGPLPVNAMGLAAFAVLGIANPGFWFLGAAAEAGYLLYLSGSSRFQKLIQGERLLVGKKEYEKKLARVVSRLSTPAQERYHRLLDQCRAVMGISETLEEESLDSVKSMRTGGLNQLLWIFLRLLTSREVIVQNMSRVNRNNLVAEVEKSEKQLEEAGPESPLSRAFQGTLEIQRKRLENFDHAQESRQVIEAELSRIEQQVVLIREEAAVAGKSAFLSDRLDSVSTALTETNRWMEQNAEIFGGLGDDGLGSAPPELPELPPTLPRELESDVQ